MPVHAKLRLLLRNVATISVVAGFLFVVCAQPAGASWSVDDDAGFATARSMVMPTGPAASASVAVDDVTVSWPAVTLPGGSAVEGYIVTRYTSGGAPVVPNSSCQGIITTTSCTEFDLSVGTWTYGVKAVKASWSGIEGARSGSVTTVTPDTTAPAVTLGALIKSTGGDENVIRQAGSYYVYANAADVGSPQSGIASVTANVSTITTGSTAAPLTSGSYTVNGTTYSYRSALLAANATITAGPTTISFRATDQAGNIGTLNGHPVTIDNTPPAITDIQTINGGVLGKADTGDRIIYTYSEPIDANSILAGWNGSLMNVTVRLNNNTTVGDNILVYNAANTTNSKIGTVRLSSLNYVTANITFTNSTIVRSGSTITVTLGTTAGVAGTVTTAGAMRWTPIVGAVDWGSNPLPTTFLTEPGVSDIDL